jgi:hypothetical protein
LRTASSKRIVVPPSLTSVPGGMIALEVIARDREVADDERVVARGPDRHDVVADHVLAAVRTVDDLDAHRRHDLLPGSRLKDCLLAVHAWCSCCAHCRVLPT